jgi:hypothetical protein
MSEHTRIGQKSINVHAASTRSTADVVHFVVQGTRQSQVPVDSDDDIDSIIVKIKTKISPLLDHVSVLHIELFENEGSTVPLTSTEPWSEQVTWGRSSAPLILKVVKTDGKKYGSARNCFNFG